MIIRILLLSSIFSLFGCVTAAKKNDLSDISDIKKCAALMYSYENIGRNLELDNDLIVELKKQEENLNCSKYSKSQIENEAEINSILSRLNYDIYFGKTKNKRKSDFLKSAKKCIDKVDYEYINLSKKFPELKNHYFDKPSKTIEKSTNFESKHDLKLKSGNKRDDNLYSDLQIFSNKRNVDINANLSVVDLEIMRCIADEGFCAHNDRILEYSHTKKVGRIWDGENFTNISINLCVPDYCNPSNAELIMDVYPSLNSVIKLCGSK